VLLDLDAADECDGGNGNTDQSECRTRQPLTAAGEELGRETVGRRGLVNESWRLRMCRAHWVSYS
jgi:hypothetical protein